MTPLPCHRTARRAGICASLAVLLLALVAGCSSPGPAFSGPPVRVAVAGHTFDVYRAGDRARAVRVNRTWLPDPAEVMAAGLLATEQATGCRVRRGSAGGDHAIAEYRLIC